MTRMRTVQPRPADNCPCDQQRQEVVGGGRYNGCISTCRLHTGYWLPRPLFQLCFNCTSPTPAGWLGEWDGLPLRTPASPALQICAMRTEDSMSQLTAIDVRSGASARGGREILPFLQSMAHCPLVRLDVCTGERVAFNKAAMALVDSISCKSCCLVSASIRRPLGWTGLILPCSIHSLQIACPTYRTSSWMK